MWQIFSLLSAIFAALTAIFAKIGVKGIDSDLATAIRTIVILMLAWAIVIAKGGIDNIGTLTRQNWLFLLLSGITTGLSWIFYFKAIQLGKVSQVAPVDKASLALTLLLSAVILKEVITWKIAIGAALILGGTFVIIF